MQQIHTFEKLEQDNVLLENDLNNLLVIRIVTNHFISSICFKNRVSQASVHTHTQTDIQAHTNVILHLK